MRNKRAKVEHKLEQIEVEQVKVEQPILPRMLTLDMLASLPDAVVRPTAQPDEHTVGLSAYELKEAVSDHWQSSPAYAETVYRLLTMSVEELKRSGQFVPCWKAA